MIPTSYFFQERRNSGPPRSDRGRQESSRARNTPLLRTPNTSYEARRSQSPQFKGARRENFQISVRNETYRTRSKFLVLRRFIRDRSPITPHKTLEKCWPFLTLPSATVRIKQHPPPPNYVSICQSPARWTEFQN